MSASPPSPIGGQPPFAATVSAQPNGAQAAPPLNQGVQIPPVTPPKKRGVGWFSWEADERNQLEKDGSQSHNIRRVAAYGALVLAFVLYMGGLAAIALFLGLFPNRPRVDAGMWHIVVATLVALFTVPTVLIIAVLKTSAGLKAEDSMPASFQEALGKMIEKLVDKIAS